MGYKLLGFAVWQGGKWYVRRRFGATARKAAVAGLAALALGGGIAIALRQQGSD